jgi:hypothetical protein
MKHTYPSKYGRGIHWSIDMAWDILDRLPPGQLTKTQRAYMAGLIAGTLEKIHDKGRRKAARAGMAKLVAGGAE